MDIAKSSSKNEKHREKPLLATDFMNLVNFVPRYSSLIHIAKLNHDNCNNRTRMRLQNSIICSSKASQQ